MGQSAKLERQSLRKHANIPNFHDVQKPASTSPRAIFSRHVLYYSSLLFIVKSILPQSTSNVDILTSFS